MTNLVFVHDHKFRKINEEYYSTGGLSQEVLNRYLEVFDSITIIARVVVEEDANPKYSKISSKKVEIINGLNLSNEQFEQIILNSTHLISRVPSYFAFKAALIARKNKIPYLIEVVACSWDILFNHSLKGKILALPSYLLTKNIVKHSPYVLYVTNEFLQKRYPSNGKTIGVSDVVLNNTNETILSSRITKIQQMDKTEKIVIGTISAIDVKYKGQQYVIEALAELKKQGYTNFEYQLVGGGSKKYLYSIIKKLNLEENVKLLGTIPHGKIFDWLDSIDIYIQPSKTEGFPRSLIEAMSRAVPSIGANSGGIPELLDSDYIFKNKSNVRQIINFLKSISKKDLKKQAERNFKESFKYLENELSMKRSSFFLEFKDNK